MIIDAHAHIYPASIAQKAVSAVGVFYGVEASMYGEGHSDDLIKRGNKVSITHYIVHSVATSPRSVDKINSFIAEQSQLHPEFIPFGTMHPDCEDLDACIDNAASKGIKGFKIHPDTQKVNMDDPRFMEFYARIEGKFPLVIHMGDYRHVYSRPERLISILKTFPNLVIDAAHFGGWSIYDVAFDILHDRSISLDNVFVDSSSTFALVGSRHMKELISLWGSEKVMFGSDYPMWNPSSELENLYSCKLPEEDLEKILYKNALRFIDASSV